MSKGRLPDCEHGQTSGFCWFCLTPEEQVVHRAAWDRLAAEIPDLAAVLEESRREIAAGKVITLDSGKGRTVAIPHTVFRHIVDVIHADKVERGKRD